MTTKSSAEPEELNRGDPSENVNVGCLEQAPRPERVAEIAEAIAALVASGSSSVSPEISGPPYRERIVLKPNGRANGKLRVVDSPCGVAGVAATPCKQGHAWFEARFGELRGAIERLASANPGVGVDDAAALNARLDDLKRRLDGALEAQSHEDALKSLECQLAGLAGYLERTREWAEAGQARTEARLEGFEGRLDNLDQAAARSQQAIENIPEQTSAQISEAMQRIPTPAGLVRIERDVRALSVATRESEERAVEAVSELHGALQMILDQLASMGEKLSSVGEARDRSRVATQSEESAATSTSNVEPFVRPDRAKTDRPSVDAPARGKFGRKLAASGSTHHRGSRLALVGAVAIFAVTGVAMFAHHFHVPKASDFIVGGAWRTEPAQPSTVDSGVAAGTDGAPVAANGRAAEVASAADSVPGRGSSAGGPLNSAQPAGPVVARAEPVIRGPASGTAAPRNFSPSQPASDLWVAHAEQPPVATGGKASDDSAASAGQEWRSVETVTLPMSLGSERVRIAAIAGETGAQYLVANCYEAGLGVERDAAAAARWFRRAASQNHAPSQYRLATLYERGHGVEKNLAIAESLYRSAANLGNVKAMHNLAVMLIHKQGEAPDYQVAASWFMRAAELGFTDSQYNLAILYEQGLGVPRDLAMAYKWFSLSAQGGDHQAAAQRDRLVEMLPVNDVARLNAEAAMWRAHPVEENANQVQMPQEQAEGGASPTPSGYGAKQPDRRAVEPAAASRRPRELKRRSQRSVPDQGGKPREQAAVMVNSRNIAAQFGLIQLGYKIGPTDGQMGPKTREAIRRFQRDHGLAVTGDVTDALLMKLAFTRRDNG